MLLPRIGKNFYHDKGIFALVNLDEMDCLVVLIRGKKVKIIVDPSIPSLKADGEEIITEYGNKGTYALLKYDYSKN